jgi:ABC-type phosphate transport system substrate-binding protein
MKIKKLLGSLIAGTAMLAIAGTASAVNYEANIYGASAQFKFWNLLAADFIHNHDATNCAGVTVDHYDDGSAQGISKATCTNGDTYLIRVASKASYDGILALKGDASKAGTAACASGSTGDPGSTLRPYYRLMIDDTTCTGSGASMTCSNTALKCARVNVAASDVAGGSFKQISNGALKGPASNGTTAYTTRSFSGINVTGLSADQEFVVPFAFFVNNQVTDSRLGTSTTMDNLTRLQAVLLFSAQVKNWQQLGSVYPNLPTAICLRHAGSGTHATLDYAVVRGNGWGSNLPVTENNPADADNYNSNLPIVYFNDGTGDETTCVNSNTVKDSSGADITVGAIGYADADLAVSSTNHTVSGKANIREIKYQGEYALADAVKKGRYDFYTNEWAYKDSSLSGDTLTVVNAILTYAKSNVPTAETDFWADTNSMSFTKATDQQYPHK